MHDAAQCSMRKHVRECFAVLGISIRCVRQIWLMLRCDVRWNWQHAACGSGYLRLAYALCAMPGLASVLNYGLRDPEEDLRERQDSEAEADVDESDEYVWPSKSPHLFYPVPPEEATMCAVHRWFTDGVPVELKAPRTGSCTFGHEYEHKKVSDACKILYPDALCGCTRPLFELRCPAEKPCVVVYMALGMGSSISMTSHVSLCVCCIL